MLVEIISVTVIMVLVLSIAVGAHLMWKRHQSFDSVVTEITAHLSLARQYAITQGEPATFTVSNLALTRHESHRLRFDNDFAAPESLAEERGLFLVSAASTNLNAVTDWEELLDYDRILLGDVIRLPRHMLWLRPDSATTTAEFLPTDPLHITFMPDGSCAEDDSNWPDTPRDLVFFHNLSSASRTNRLMRRTIRINPLTGLARVLTTTEEIEEP